MKQLLLLTPFLLLAADPAASQEVLTLTGTVEGRLEASDTLQMEGEISRLVPIDVPAGTRLNVTLESPEFDAYLALVEVTGEDVYSLSENDDFPGLSSPTDSRARALVEDGIGYAAWVGSFDGSGLGTFTLRAAEAAPDEIFPVPLDMGTWVDGVLDDADPRSDGGDPMDVFEFEAYGGQRVLALGEGDATPTLTVVEPSSGDPVGRAVPRDGVTFLDFFVSDNGTYELRVTAPDELEGGFSLRVWTPPVTAAELHGLRVDSLIRHDLYGFSLPSPGPEFTPVRRLARPHTLYGDGFGRIWYLADQGGTTVVLFYGGMYAPLEDTDFQELASNFIGGFATGVTPRIKREDERSIRGTISDTGGGGTDARCVRGEASESPSGIRSPRGVLCVAIHSVEPTPFTTELLEGMVVR